MLIIPNYIKEELKMNKIKKLLSIVLSLSLCVLAISPVSAAKANELDVKNIESMYPNVKVTDLPSNNVDYNNAICVNSLEEYQDILENLNNLSNSTINVTPGNSDSYSSDRSLRAATDLKSSDVYSVIAGVDPIPLPPIWMNIQFNFTSKKKNGEYVFTSISNVRSWFTGLQLPTAWEWTPQNTSINYYNGNKNVDITVTGVVGMTVIYKDLPKIMEFTCSYTGSWTAR
jgi:hypothetical protein